MRLTVLETIPEDEDLRDEWNALALRVDRPQVFYTFEWSMAVQRAYHATLHPLIFLSFDDAGSLRGVVTLATRAESGHVTFFCANTADYCDFLSLPDEKAAFVGAVLSELRRRGVRDLTLTNLPADSSTVAALRQASAKNGYHLFARKAYECAQVSLSKLERKPGKNTLVLPGKKNLRRALSAMGKEAPVRLDHARSWDAAHEILPEFVLAHVARFLATGRISNLAHRERQLFLKELARLLSESGWLVLSRLMSGNDSFAWNYGFQFQDTWFWYQPTFDNNWERHSPGFCLLAKVIEEASDSSSLSVVDLGLGAEEYKDRFANSSRKTLYVTSRVSLVQHVKEILRYCAAAILKTFPRLEAGVRKIVERWRHLIEEITSDGIISTVRGLGRATSALIWSRDEILLFEWARRAVHDSDCRRIEPLDWHGLASATLQYVGDKATVAYLLRSATRLRAKKSEGFAIMGADGLFESFLWVNEFESAFRAEFGAKVDPPSADCVLLFDCWSASTRGEGLAHAPLGRIAERMQEQGKKMWAFALVDDTSLIKILKEAGFEQRCAILRRRVFGCQWLRREAGGHDAHPTPEVASGI